VALIGLACGVLLGIVPFERAFLRPLEPRRHYSDRDSIDRESTAAEEPATGRRKSLPPRGSSSDAGTGLGAPWHARCPDTFGTIRLQGTRALAALWSEAWQRRSPVRLSKPQRIGGGGFHHIG
jgi:hypothetical protein